MIIYILMTILVVVFGILHENNKLSASSKIKEGGANSESYISTNNDINSIWLVLILVVFVFVTGLQSGFGDTSNYIDQFADLKYTFAESLTAVWEDEKSPLFQIYMAFIKIFTTDSQWLLLITALISNYFVWRVVKKEAYSVPLAYYFYICSGLFMWAMNGIRQYLVATLLFSCYKLIINGKWIKWFLILFVCYFFHTSILFIIPVYFLYRSKPWTKVTIVFILAVIVIGGFYSEFSDAFFDAAEGTKFDEYTTQVDEVESTKFIRVAFMAIPTVLSFLFKEDIEKENSPLLNLATNASLLSLGIYLLAGIGAGNLIARIAVYSDLFVYVILVPFLAKKFLNSQYCYLAQGYIAASAVFFAYQTFYTFGGYWWSTWLGWYFV